MKRLSFPLLCFFLFLGLAGPTTPPLCYAATGDPPPEIGRLRMCVSEEKGRVYENEESREASTVFHDLLKEAIRKQFNFVAHGCEVYVVPEVDSFEFKVLRINETDVAKWEDIVRHFQVPKVETVIRAGGILRISVRDGKGAVLVAVEEEMDSEGKGEMDLYEKEGGVTAYIAGKHGSGAEELRKISRSIAVRNAVTEAVGKSMPKLFGRALDERLARRLRGDLPPLVEPSIARRKAEPAQVADKDRDRGAPEIGAETMADIPHGEKAGPDDIAVIIGNRRYSVPGIPNVEFADRDAAIVREFLLKTFGFRPENVLYEQDATYAKFNEIFGSRSSPHGRLYKLVKTGRGDASVFIYYVGHGAPDLETQQAYFLPVDSNPQYLATNGYPLQTFYENLAKIPAKTITIVLDTCFSGSTDRGFLFRGISPAVVKVKKEYGAPQNAVLLASASAEQVSVWYPEKKHSLFTYFLLQGIRGDADADRDGAITVGEMKTYLSRMIPYWSVRLKNVEQTPVVMGNEKEILVRLKK